MNKLIEAAKAVKRTERWVKSNVQEQELAIAWLKGEVGLTQVTKALKLNTLTESYIFLSTRLRDAYHSGLLKLK